jgi:hypothetical protein
MAVAATNLSDYRVAFVPSFQDSRDTSDVWHLPGVVKLNPDSGHGKFAHLFCLDEAGASTH